jgi:hypothetical protein
MQITFDLSEELISRLNSVEDKLPQVIELGLRELNANPQDGFNGVAEILEFLATLPTPEAIIALRPSQELQTQISSLLEKHRNQGLTDTEARMWEQYQYLEHLIRKSKATAYLKLKQQQENEQ